MENKASGRAVLPITLLLVLSSLFIWFGRSRLEQWNVDYRVLFSGNSILFFATVISILLYSKALRNANVHAFVRMVYGSLLIKMGFSIAATFLYLLVAGKDVSRNAIIGCFVLYILYTFLEVRLLMRMSKSGPSPRRPN